LNVEKSMTAGKNMSMFRLKSLPKPASSPLLQARKERDRTAPRIMMSKKAGSAPKLISRGARKPRIRGFSFP
jgi:hypothetical protein